VVGRIGGPYGVKGWVHVVSYTDPASNLLEYRPWHIRRRGRWESTELVAVKAHGDAFVAALAGIRDRDEAADYRGAEIGVDETTLPAPQENEFYWKDLIGLCVQDTEGRDLGVVVRLLETGRHDVLVVKGETGEMLIPFVDRYVVAVDVAGGGLTADWRSDY